MLTNIREQFKFDDIIFVDGGGDSLILESSDANFGSEYARAYVTFSRLVTSQNHRSIQGR